MRWYNSLDAVLLLPFWGVGMIGAHVALRLGGWSDVLIFSLSASLHFLSNFFCTKTFGVGHLGLYRLFWLL